MAVTMTTNILCFFNCRLISGPRNCQLSSVIEGFQPFYTSFGKLSMTLCFICLQNTLPVIFFFNINVKLQILMGFLTVNVFLVEKFFDMFWCKILQVLMSQKHQGFFLPPKRRFSGQECVYNKIFWVCSIIK